MDSSSTRASAAYPSDSYYHDRYTPSASPFHRSDFYSTPRSSLSDASPSSYRPSRGPSSFSAVPYSRFSPHERSFEADQSPSPMLRKGLRPASERSERSEKPEKPEKPEGSDRSEASVLGEAADRSDRSDPFDLGDWTDRIDPRSPRSPRNPRSRTNPIALSGPSGPIPRCVPSEPTEPTVQSAWIARIARIGRIARAARGRTRESIAGLRRRTEARSAKPNRRRWRRSATRSRPTGASCWRWRCSRTDAGRRGETRRSQTSADGAGAGRDLAGGRAVRGDGRADRTADDQPVRELPLPEDPGDEQRPAASAARRPCWMLRI